MAGIKEALEMEFPSEDPFADLDSQNFYIIKQTIKHSYTYVLYLLSLCSYLLEFRPKNSASFKSKNLNTFIYVDVVIQFFKMASNWIQETKRAPNTVFLCYD